MAIAQPQWEAVMDLAGPGGGYAPSVENTARAEVSLTEPGEPASAAAAAQSTQVLYAQRRSLEQRRGERLADAAVTPQAFVQRARHVMDTFAAGPQRVDRPSSVVITPEDAVPGLPTSFGPQPIEENSVDV